MKKFTIQNTSLTGLSLHTPCEWFVTGFVDGEGSFGLSVSKDSNRKTGYIISPSFSMGVHPNDRDLLEKIKALFGVGEIYINYSENIIRLKVSSIKDLTEVIIPHFEEYPLISQKLADFLLFKRVVEILKRKEHLIPGGMQEIINIRASLNTGLSDELKTAFPNTAPAPRSMIEFSGIPNPY